VLKKGAIQVNKTLVVFGQISLNSEKSMIAVLVVSQFIGYTDPLFISIVIDTG